MEFTTEQLRLLAKAERDMDDGAPFVLYDGQRLLVEKECMEYFDLRRGQTINGVIFHAMNRWMISLIEEKIIEEKLRKEEKYDTSRKPEEN